MINEIIQIAQKAGDAILEIYNKDFNVEYKDDKSPLTDADKVSNEIITEALQKLTPQIPIISEENKLLDYQIRKDWTKCWLVDPIDGTKEFIKKNGEFTVNIALIENGIPILSAVGVPAQNIIYYAEKNKGTYKIYNETTIKLEKTPIENNTIRIVGSRSHQTPELLAYVDEQKEKYANVEFVAAGSSLKFCLIAEGKADVYPRLGPTMEWDTAAGHLIATESGSDVLVWNSDEKLSYNKENLLNPFFIVQ
ncbi:MAG: 3'(2'),5'-bisphosphate nucleotidase CysQ [Sphingobacteriales bacterium]|jgi:3'(2'), 5'-bisphosphate nucleotidase|nr:MAG: 3'(2'),5'-bisphosphate nucleotidase CysQ [Sphingobacteriales bacterium]